jgi:hypothetical protein
MAQRNPAPKQRLLTGFYPKLPAGCTAVAAPSVSNVPQRMLDSPAAAASQPDENAVRMAAQKVLWITIEPTGRLPEEMELTRGLNKDGTQRLVVKRPLVKLRMRCV